MKAIINSQPDMLVIGEAANGRAAIQQFNQLRPNITVADLNLPVICGVQAVKEIRALFPNARIIVATAFANPESIREAFAAGAQGFLVKDSLRQELLTAIRGVHGGQRYLSKSITQIDW